MTPDGERPPAARWAKDQRIAHGYRSQRELLDELKKRGYRVHLSQIGELETLGLIDSPARRRLLKQPVPPPRPSHVGSRRFPGG